MCVLTFFNGSAQIPFTLSKKLSAARDERSPKIKNVTLVHSAHDPTLSFKCSNICSMRTIKCHHKKRMVIGWALLGEVRGPWSGRRTSGLGGRASMHPSRPRRHYPKTEGSCGENKIGDWNFQKVNSWVINASCLIKGTDLRMMVGGWT